MTNNTENLVLEMLKVLRSEVATLRSEMRGHFADLKQRMLAIKHMTTTPATKHRS